MNGATKNVSFENSITNSNLIENEERKFRRKLGLLDLFMIGITGVIGSGWLFSPLYAANAAGPASIASWVLGGALVLMVGLVFSQLMRFKSEAGGITRYPYYTNGALAGTITGWTLWLAYSMNPPSESSGLVQYMSSYVPGLYINGALTPVGLAIAISFMGLFVLVNYFGVVIFSKIINAITALKLVVPTITMVTLFLVSFKLRNFSAYGVAPYGPFSVVSAIVTSGIVYSYLGFQAVINLAGESRNPKRDGPLSLILVIIFSVVFYVVLQIAFIGSVPASDISKGWAFLSLPSPFADIAVSFNMFWLYTLIIADSIYSPSGSSMAAVASNSRNLYALSKNGTLPSFFLRVDNNTGIPRRALLFNFVISLIVLVTLKSWHQIIETLGILLLISFIGSAVSSGVIGSIKRYSSIKMPFIVIVSAIVFVFSGLIISISSFSKVLVVSLLLVPSLLLFAVSSGRGNRVIADVKAGLWFIIYVMEIAILSFIYNEHYVSGYIFLGAYLLSSTITFILARRSGVKFMHQAGEYDIAEIP